MAFADRRFETALSHALSVVAHIRARAEAQDAAAHARDVAALNRAQAADARDRALAQRAAAAAHEDDRLRVADLPTRQLLDEVAQQRMLAAHERALAAEERAAAADDREHAARDRLRALADREALARLVVEEANARS